MRKLPSFGLFDIPIVSGCFMVMSRSAIENIGFFDERYFLYFEDWDLSRRISLKYRTVFNSSVSAVHGYHSGANQNPTLFYHFLRSAILYFKKWGFIMDAERRRINKNTLNSLHNA